MIFHVTCKLIDIPLDPDDLLVRFGFQRGGPVQQAVDSAFIRNSRRKIPASPDRTLENSVDLFTEIGSGIIVYFTPYARFQYYGMVMTDELGRTWVGPGEKKPIITNRPLNYDKSQNPEAGPFWAERTKADDLPDILDEARKAIPRR